MKPAAYTAIVASFALALLAPASLLAQEPAQQPSGLRIIPRVEAGALAVLSHFYQAGASADGNTLFDFVNMGGQNILLPYERYSVDILAGRRNRITFLYQPLSPKTSVKATTSFKINGVDFPSGSPVDILYGFDFWRLSYLFSFVETEGTRIEAGASLQIRDANIVFTATDGSARADQRNVGPVPVLKLRAEQRLGKGISVIFEGDGFYATSAIFNGAGFSFKGWVWDASLALEAAGRYGYPVRLSVRSIGGGAEGTDKSGKYTYNSLATLAISLGLGL
jgi:hypothetical protein